MSSTSLAFEFPSTTSTIPFPTISGPAWITGQFPPSLTITNNRATENLLADVPFYAVGVLAIGVATFIFVMNRMQRHIFDVLLATFLGFIAAIIDLGQLIIISRTRTIFTAGIFPMRIARELGYAVSFGMRFFFFWRFVAMPPRGEIPVLPTPGRSNRVSLSIDDELHSGSWGRWGVIGIFTKYLLLMGAIAVGVTQAIWRLGFTFGFTRFTTVYRADAIMEIVLSGYFLLKLVANVYVSPLTPRWRTARDYLPVATAMSTGLGIAVGNLLCMRFSESPLGRFLQAIELYILILYVLIATFYGMPVRASMIADALDRERVRANSSFVGINMSGSMRGSTFRVTPPNVSTPELPTTRELEAAGTNGVPTRLLRPDQPRRTSTAERFANWIQNRLSGRPSDRDLDPQAYSNLVRAGDVENGQTETFDYTDKQHQSADYLSEISVGPRQHPNKRQSTYAESRTSPTGTSTAVNDTPQFPKEGRASPVIAAYTPATSYAPAESEPAGPNTRRPAPSTVASVYSPRISQAFSPVTVTALAPITPLSIRTLSNKARPPASGPAPLPLPPPIAMPVPVVPKVTTPPPAILDPESPSRASARVTREYGLSTRTTSPLPLRVTNRTPHLGNDSPVYELEGVISSLGGDLLPDQDIPPLRITPNGRTYSPGAASFMRKQAELDRSVADLQAFSPENSRKPLYGIDGYVNPSVPSLGQESTSLRSDFSLSNFPSPPVARLSFPAASRRTSVTVRPGEVDLDDLRFTLAPPRMPAANPDGRQVSFPSTTRGSDILQIQSRPAANSNGTQWDVTSFIGGSETRTPSSATIARPDSQGRPLSYARNQIVRRDTIDTQRLSMVAEALSNGAGTPDLPDDENSVRDARIVDLRRTPSLSRARIIEGPLTASSLGSGNPQPELEPAPMPTPAERLAAFRARPTFKSALPSSPRPTYRAESPNPLGRRSPLGVDPGAASASTSTPAPSALQPQPLISNLQLAQSTGQQPTQIPGFTPQPRPFIPSNNVRTPPRGGLRNIRIGGPVGQPRNEGSFGEGAFERPRPAPLVLNGTTRMASPTGGVI